MSPLEDYESYDALGLADLVAKGEVTATELLDAAIERVESRNPELNAVVYPWYDEARSAIAAGLPEGPFRGVPFLLKDLYTLYAGQLISNGSRLFEGLVPDHDSELVARYRRAGLVIFGRTTSPEFGLTTTTESRLHGQTRNPWSLSHTTGGSSGGAAAVVAARILPVANASDGGGSIRIPASCCGLFGLKPTRGRNPMGPDVGEGGSGMSTTHVVSLSVRDSAAMLDATAGPDLGAPYWAEPPARPWLEEVGASPGRLRIAWQTRAFNGAETHPDCLAAAAAAARLCEELGHDVEVAELAVDAEQIGEATLTLIGANVRAAAEDRAAELGRALAPEDLEPITYGMAMRAEGASASQYARSVRSVRLLHAAGRRVARFLERYDVLLTPTMATPPLELGRLSLSRTDLDGYRDDIGLTVGFTSLFNAAGNPAMSVPLAWNGVGLPIGTQFVGRFGDEATLFRLAAQLEEARPWRDRRPTA
jgi:Asp-tRNA(Asn)/Glu-tRNA(Gln) amidotransferase A subunit family amidase